VIKKVFNNAMENNFSILNLDFSPILGNKKKNIEYLMMIKKESNINCNVSDANIETVIQNAKDFLSGDTCE
jgi:23S rRNA (cytidine1920-2'-O)/16S rRNA (cytidine1409-2'-O)-methyltransferase